MYDVKTKLILLLKSDTYEWEDRTESVIDIKKSVTKGGFSGYEVTFTGGSKYTYRKSFVKLYESSIKLDISKGTVIIDKKLHLNVSEIYQFNETYKVFFTDGTTLVTHKLELLDDKNYSKRKIFDYYKKLAFYAADINEDDDSIDSFILNQYEHMDVISNSSSLYAYLNKSNYQFLFDKHILLPFDFNSSQKQSILNALGSQLSIIEGPPGCGKTQTILNLIVNLLVQNKKIAVVSNNNTAIKNVVEKLDEEGYGYLTALLGNNDNKDTFFDHIDSSKLNSFIEDMSQRIDDINHKYEFNQYSTILEKLLKKQNQKAELLMLHENLEIEKGKLKSTTDLYTLSKKLKKHVTSDAILKLKIKIEQKRKIKFLLRRKIRKTIRFKIGKNTDLIRLLNSLEQTYYEVKLLEIENQIKEIVSYFDKYNYEEIYSQYKTNSKMHFDFYLYSKFKDYQDVEFTKNNYIQKFNQFLNRYPVLLSTSHSLLNSISKETLFDYIIVDEASQSDLLSSVLAMSASKNIVIVGDSKQLDMIDNSKLLEVSHTLALMNNVPDCYLYNENSLIKSMINVYDNIPTTILKEHYRCHPIIAQYFNQKFYENELIIMSKHVHEEAITLIELVDGNHARKNPNGSGQYNQREIDEVSSYIKDLKYDSIGIISPFRYQVEKYTENLLDMEKVEIDTVHKFQGRQKDLIILSTVVNDLNRTEKNERFIDFIDNHKLFNVAISRAKKHLTLIATKGVFESSNNHFVEFIKYAKYHSKNTEKLDGKVTSVFDILYSDYKRNYLHENPIRHKKNIIVSEIIVSEILEELLKEFAHLKFAMHVSLGKILDNFEGFDKSEINYLTHHWTHVDFMIYNNLTKETILFIEVDGVKYHEQNKKQNIHDNIKTRAFAQNHLELMRIKTNESSIESKIKQRILNKLQ